MHDTTEVLICGAGPSGMAAAVAFGAAGFDVVCIDPAPPVTSEADPTADIRTTAILQPGRDLLQASGIWVRLAPFATSLQVMQIMDATQEEPVQKAFDAADLGDAPFGWNLPNWLIRREMLAHLEQMPNVRFLPGVGFAGMTPRTAHAKVRLSDCSNLTAKLVVAADGRNSAVRQAWGIDVRTTHYGQKALAFAVTHPKPHNNVSTEVHKSGGPFTLVPLPDLDGQPRSAVVWMTTGSEPERLAALPETEFNIEASERSAGVLGPLTLSSRRAVWPIINQIAQQFYGPRVALMAEAAHVVPPIGAQGLNMSLADLSALLKLAEQNRDDPGNPDMLKTYSRTRWPDVQARVLGIDALNRTSMAGNSAVQALRRGGVAMLHDLKPVRHMAMRLGLGASG